MTAKSYGEAIPVGHVETVQIKRDISVVELEQLISQFDPLDPADRRAIDLKLPTKVEGGILSDIWASIFVGTLARKSLMRLVGWGLTSEITAASAIASSPAFLSALTTAASIGPERGPDVDLADTRRQFIIKAKGLVDPESGVSRSIVEFDPEYSVAPALRGGSGFDIVSPLDRKRIFEQQILRFRQALEIGAIRRGISPVKAGPAGDIGRFLSELHENGFEHGSRDPLGNTIAGTRLLRIKKHAANNKQQLVDRCANLPVLAEHIEQSVPGVAATPALIEASISDFGLGIVDAFYASDAGRNVNISSRRELLEALIYERLSSKGSDPSAGLGIQKALTAARQMGAFVSLRTAEFWLIASFANPGDQPRLHDLSSEVRGRVAGTHWQFFWSQS